MSLADWRKNGWLIEHRTSAREVADLFPVVERDLADSAAEQRVAEAAPRRPRVTRGQGRRGAWRSVGGSCVALAGLSQLVAALVVQQPQQPRFKTGVDVVLIDVTVVDHDGRPAGDLRPEDFQVTIDRKPRKIISTDFIRFDTRTSVSRERRPGAMPAGPGPSAHPSLPAPARNVLLVVDVDSMEPGDGMLLRKVAASFFDQLAPADRVAVVAVPRLKSQVELTSKKGDAKKALESFITGNERYRPMRYVIGLAEAYEVERDPAALAGIIVRNCSGGGRGRGDSGCAEDVRVETRQVALQGQVRSKATLDALRDLGLALRQVAGPKTMVLVTGGMPPPDIHQGFAYSQLEAALAAAQVSLYTLYLEQPVFGQVKYQVASAELAMRDQRFEREGIENATASAGGTFVEMIGTLEPYFDRIATELSGSYVLGVQVEAADRDSRPHYIEVKVNRPHLDVRARKYYVIEPEKPSALRVGREARPARLPARTVMHLTAPEVRVVIERAGEYLRAYADELSGLVAQEDYAQRQYIVQRVAGSGPMTKAQLVLEAQCQLKSDFLLVKAPGVSAWIPFRDVYEVDGKKVRDRDERLQKLFLEQPRVATERAEEIARESARYNIGFVGRQINVPTFALAFVDATNLGGFTFTKAGESTISGVPTWQIAYREWQSPTIVHGPNGDLPAEGTLWIDPVQGRVLKTIMRLKFDADTTEEVTVIYARTPRTGDTWVPLDMHEVYMGTTRQLDCVATYSNIRRFQVSTEVQIK